MIQIGLQQLVKQVVGSLAAAVREDLAASEHGDGEPAELFDDPHALQPRIDLSGTPQLGQALEVAVASNQIVADLHQGIAKTFVSAADQGGGVIDLVALVTSGEQASAAGDGVGIRVVLDRPHFAGKVRRGDDVNAWNGEQQDIGGLDEIAGDLPFQSRDLLGFLGEIVVQVCQDPLSHQGIIGRGIGVLGPGQDAEQRCALKPEPLLLEQLRESRGAGHDDLLGGSEVSSHGFQLAHALAGFTNHGEQHMLKSSPSTCGPVVGLAVACWLLCLPEAVSAADQTGGEVMDAPRRSLRVELSGQEYNVVKTSWPGIGCWFWTAEDFQPNAYKRFIDLHEKHSGYGLLTTSIRHTVEVTQPAVHDQIKRAAEYARAHGMKVVMDLDVRLARQSFMQKHPEEMQEIVRLREVALQPDGSATLQIPAMTLADHYTPTTRGVRAEVEDEAVI